MRSLPVFALPEIEEDLRQAMQHYASWRSDGAQHLRQKYEETISWIGWNPDSFPQKHGVVRRAILKQSYYIVYFLLETGRIIVVAVLDGRRNPADIRSMIKKRKSRTRR